jgi:hypothetical protein
MKRMLKRAAHARGQHGIALLFTLCILSMALIVAMIFSSISSTSRKVAAAYVDTSSAKILADGVVNRAILALMQSESASYVCSNYNSTTPGNKNANEYASDWIWKLEKPGLFSFNDGPLRFNRTASQYYDLDDSRCPSWEYVFTKNGYGDAQERIYGRYAYVAIGQNDYLNPNAIGNREKVDDGSAFDKRLGRYTCEPQFVFKSTRNGWDYSNIISQKTLHDKYSGAGPEGWTDIDVFINDLAGSGGPSSADKQLKMMIDQYFDLSGEREHNKFRADGKEITDLTKAPGTGESYRFPLIRNDWDSISIDTIKSAIPWFGNANTSQANVDQTVANLINYNASERVPAVSRGNWFTDEVPFTGNKRTPYINEVQGEVSVGGHLGFPLKRYEFEGDPPTTRVWYVWYTDCTYDHEITLRVETINLYGSNAIPVRNPILIGEISYQYLNPSAGTWIPQSIRFDAGTQWDVASEQKGIYTVYTFTLENNAVGSVTTPERGPYDKPMGHDSDFYEYIKVRDVKVSLDRVILQDNYGNADLALMTSALQTGRTFTGESVVAGAGDFSRRFYFDSQVNDPRFNLARTQWSSPSFTEGDNVELGTFNSAVKYNKNDSNNCDPGEDPGSNKISTAYIPHRPMQSLWELGAIHRGAPWQTINLKCASKNGTAMGSYQDGDGHLLDQVALTSPDRVRDPVLGLINLNCVASFGGSSAPFAFKSLFTNFPVYKSYDAMYRGSAEGGTIRGDSVDSDKTGDMDADTYAKELSEAVTYAISQGHLPRRTAVFPEKYSDSQMKTIVKRNVPDAEAEEIYCRVVNLLKWNRQPLRRATVLVLAQTIRDIGGASLERVLPEKTLDLMHDSGFVAYKSGNANSNKVAPSAVNESWLRSNYKSRSVALRNYDNFYDEITGETKIIVRLEWDESANDNKGAWKVTRREYAE